MCVCVCVCVCVCLPAAKLQLLQLWHSCLCMTVTVGQNLHDLLGKYVHTLNPATASAIDSQIEWRAMCTEGDERRDACGRVVGFFWGLLGGRLPTLCAPNPGESAGHCGSLLVHQPESWERGFQLRRADDKQVFSKSSSLGFSLCSFILAVFLSALFWVQCTVSPSQL